MADTGRPDPTTRLPTPPAAALEIPLPPSLPPPPAAAAAAKPLPFAPPPTPPPPPPNPPLDVFAACLDEEEGFLLPGVLPPLPPLGLDVDVRRLFDLLLGDGVLGPVPELVEKRFSKAARWERPGGHTMRGWGRCEGVELAEHVRADGGAQPEFATAVGTSVVGECTD